MQENLINPQAVEASVKSLFGSYEKFVMHLIKRRQELESEKSRLNQRLKDLNKEVNLINKVLTGFHGKKLNGLYYDFNSNGFSEQKPSIIPGKENINLSESIAELLDLNKKLQQEKPAEERQTIQQKALGEYKSSVLDIIHRDYLPQFSLADLEKDVLDLNKMSSAFRNNLSPGEFAHSFAKEFNLSSVKQQGVKIK